MIKKWLAIFMLLLGLAVISNGCAFEMKVAPKSSASK